MTTARFVIGLLTLAAIVVPPAVAGWRWQRALPARDVALRVLAEGVIAVSLLVVTAELLGSVGWFRPPALLAGSWLGSAAAFAVARRVESNGSANDPSPVGDLPRWVTGAALAVTAGVAVRWTAVTVRYFATGIVDVDSRQYHLPFATEFVRTGWLTRFHPLWVDPIHMSYPATTELIQAIGMLTMGRDVLAPLPNLGWFALLLLAGWCAGIRDGVAPLTLLGAAWIATVPTLLYTNGGSALSDTAMLACLMAAVALWRNSDGDLGWLAVSGLALGLSVASKLTVAPTAAAFAIAVVVLAPSARRRKTLGVFAGAMAAACSFWFVRNLFRTGSPLPNLDLPLFPSTPLPLVDRFGYTVSDFLTDGDAWRTVFWPGVRVFFGWSGLLAAVAGVAALRGIVRSKDRALLVLTGCALFGLVTYLVVPAGAWGVDGEPNLLLFTVNLRYALPPLSLLLVVAALAIRSAAPWLRAGYGAVLAAAVALQAFRPGDYELPATRYTLAAVAIVASIAVAAAAARFVPVTHRMKWAAAAAVVVVAVAVAGPPIARRQLNRSAATAAADPVFGWASSLEDARIGYYSVLGHYPMYGPRWRNDLVYVGVKGPHGAFRAVESCEEYVDILEREQLDYVVLGPPELVYQEIDLQGWTATQTGSAKVLDAPPYAVFKVAPPYDRASCQAAP